MKININITGRQIADAMVAAIESSAGSGYWCKSIVPSYELLAAANGHAPWYDAAQAYETKGQLFQVHEVDETTGKVRVHCIGHRVLRAGLEKMTPKHLGALGRILDSNGDAPDADVMLQYIVFGQVKYG